MIVIHEGHFALLVAIMRKEINSPKQAFMRLNKEKPARNDYEGKDGATPDLIAKMRLEGKTWRVIIKFFFPNIAKKDKREFANKKSMFRYRYKQSRYYPKGA